MPKTRPGGPLYLVQSGASVYHIVSVCDYVQMQLAHHRYILYTPTMIRGMSLLSFCYILTAITEIDCGISKLKLPLCSVSLL